MTVNDVVPIDIRVPVGASLPDLAETARECERAGLHGVGVPDHHHTGRDAYLALAAMGMATDRLRLYPATSNVVTRHPMVLAALANSLDEIAPGRAMLTVAPGFLSVEKAGRPRARIGEMRTAVQSLRDLVATGEASYQGRSLTLFHHPGDRSAVYVLASGPRLLELAGEVADGVMMLVGLHPSAVAAARAHVRVGAERAGRDPAEIEEILIVPIGLGDQDSSRDWVRGWFREDKRWLSYPSESNLRWLRHAGIDLPPDYDPASISTGEADRILDAFGVFGSPEQCADRLLRARVDVGLERAFLFPAHTWNESYHLPLPEIAAYRSVMRGRLEAGW